MTIDAPYGSWESPVTSKAITAGSVRLGDVMLQKDGSLLWIEGRPQEAGRNVMCKYDPDDANCSERKAVDITPEKTNVRSRVHEYGGAAVTQGLDDTIFYSEFTTQRLMKLIKDAAPEPVTPDGERFRFADGVGVVGSDRLVMVREDQGSGHGARLLCRPSCLPRRRTASLYRMESPQHALGCYRASFGVHDG
jgi:hypothetical protein